MKDMGVRRLFSMTGVIPGEIFLDCPFIFGV
jgi:hypothetical protein